MAVQSGSSYPHSEEHTFVYSLMGRQAEDDPISRAWARLYDRGINCGPALTGVLQKDEHTEIQFFLFAVAERNLLPENVNLTSVFSDARGIVGTESGI